LPTSFIDLVSRLLAKRPGDRPASAAVVSEELQAITRSVSLTAVPPAPGDTRIAPASQAVDKDDLLWSGAQPKSGSQVAETPSPPATGLRQTRSGESSETSRRRTLQAERRQVTVLVCGFDLFESEAYLSVDTEDQARILRTFQEACELAIRQFDGAVLQCNEQ